MIQSRVLRRSLTRGVAVVALVSLVLSACSDDGGEEGEPVTTDPSGPTTTTTIPGTTAPVPEGGDELVDLRISFVEFGDDGYVEIVNSGDDDLDLDGIYSCQYPDYQNLGEVVEGGVIAAGDTARIPAAVLGGLDSTSGEAALYRGNSFDSADAILSYVQWGEGGHRRASVAVEAGIWPSVDDAVPLDPEFNSIESGGDPADPNNWS